MPAPRLALCSVPTSEVLALTAELAGLGGGDVTVGRGWVGAIAPAGSAAAAAASLDASFPDANALCAAVQQELWPWLRSGYSATLLLLGAASGSSSSSADGSAAKMLTAGEVLARVGGTALDEGCQLGLSWQLVSGDAVHGPLAGHNQAAVASSAKAPQAQPARRPSSRLGREVAADPSGASAQELTVRAATANELAELLSAVRQQEQQLAAAAGDASPPALVLRLQLRGPGSGTGAVLNVLQLPASSSSSSSSSSRSSSGGSDIGGRSSGGSPGEKQPAAAGGQQEALLRLLAEVADLHQRRREGEHLLASAKQSRLNGLTAPLLGAGARLFVAAELPAAGSDSTSGSDVSEQAGPDRLLPLLAALQQVRVVCTKGAAAAALAPAGDAAPWLPCSAFLQELQERRQAERQRRAEVAALAAAEAARRERLRAAVQERQQRAAAPGQQLRALDEPARQARQQQQQQKQDQQVQKDQQAWEHQQDVQVPGSSASGPQTNGTSPGPPEPRRQPSLPAEQAQQQAQQTQQQAANSAVSESPAHLAEQQEAQEAGPWPQQDGLSPGACGSSSSLQHLRQQFHSLYAAVAVPQHQAGAAAAADQPGSSVSRADSPGGKQVKGYAGATGGSPSLARQQQQQQQQGQQEGQSRTIAQGVAAADDIAMHVAALRMQAAVEAKRALQAQQELLGSAPTNAAAGAAAAAEAGREAAEGAAGEPADAAFAWMPGGSDCRGSRPGSGSLGQKLEAELLQLQLEAAARAAGATTPEQSGADLASLADLDTGLPSLAAVFRAPASRAAAVASSVRQAGCSSGAEQQEQQWQQRTAESAGAGRSWAGAEAAAGAALLGGRPSAALSQGAGGTEMSDVFRSDCMPLFTPPGAAAAAAAAAWRSESTQQPASPGDAWWEAVGQCAESTGGLPEQHGPRQQLEQQEIQELWQASGGLAGGSCGSYAASWRHQPASSLSVAAELAAAAGMAAAAPANSAAQASPALGEEACSGSSRSSRARPGHQSHNPSLQSPAAPVALVPGDSSQQEALDASVVLEELQREQRVSAALLHQLHEVQQALEEAVAAAAAAQQPLAPVVDDPADFNGLLAALQRERQQTAALQRQLLLQRQQGEERELALEARLHTLQRQLHVAEARCRAWEQQSPLGQLFQRCEEELQREQARGQRLEEENRQLAALLAEADLDRLTGAAAQLGDESAALCREHQRRLAQAQGQLRRLQEQQAALQKGLQAAQRRDRLAELCRRQAESGQRAAAKTRQQLAAQQQQLEAQSLAAAEAAAEAARLREQLRQAEVELGRALADRADLSDTVASLRQQVGLLRGQASRDRILKSIQGG
ncbi:hypothetical protein ABPG75_012375 [Micractinium tetrahymenae]